MFKFETVTLRDVNGQPVIEVSGSLDGDPDRVKHIIFIIGQGDLSATDHANHPWSADGWDGQVSGEGFKAGRAQAVGVAVNIRGDTASEAFPSYETLSWAQEITITKSSASG